MKFFDLLFQDNLFLFWGENRSKKKWYFFPNCDTAMTLVPYHTVVAWGRGSETGPGHLDGLLHDSALALRWYSSVVLSARLSQEAAIVV